MSFEFDMPSHHKSIIKVKDTIGVNDMRSIMEERVKIIFTPMRWKPCKIRK